VTKTNRKKPKISAEAMAEVDRRLLAGEKLRVISEATKVSIARIWNRGVAIGLWRRKRAPNGVDVALIDLAIEQRARAAASQRRRDRAAAARMQVLEDLQKLVPGYKGVGHVLVGMHRVPEVPRRST
jgi:hypothetical protein